MIGTGTIERIRSWLSDGPARLAYIASELVQVQGSRFCPHDGSRMAVTQQYHQWWKLTDSERNLKVYRGTEHGKQCFSAKNC